MFGNKKEIDLLQSHLAALDAKKQSLQQLHEHQEAGISALEGELARRRVRARPAVAANGIMKAMDTNVFPKLPGYRAVESPHIPAPRHGQEAVAQFRSNDHAPVSGKPAGHGTCQHAGDRGAGSHAVRGESDNSLLCDSGA